SGKIIFNNKRSVIDCLIRDLSDSGACLQINSAIGIPEQFELQIYGTRNLRSCRMAWVTDTRLGIEFSYDSINANFLSASSKRIHRSDLVRDQLPTLRAA